MAILSRNKRQLTYIYSSLSHLGKQVLGYVQGARTKVETIDIANEKIADSIWIELAENLGMPLGEIFEKGNGNGLEGEDTKNFDTDDWLKIINNNPGLLRRPIAVNGDKAMLISNRSEILQFFGVDSAGLEKTMGHKPPKTSSATEDEDFI
ncbi:arsenate reductase family protein [Maribacter aestuarii]|uniref:arsenate reductase family protein n=1 Tax=Maribacter aestuarii TaxID=1130723 RepID=UPI00248CDDBA|nr:ArsC/Spx/MgsR family protein [Maribacter aestuarii]